ncbi:MAG: type II toxin-antitoxin system VapC family toxin [Terracidiphilus sp.]
MTGLDTNVLIRLFAQDDPRQQAQAEALLKTLSPADPGWIAVAVVMELVWTLTSVYLLDRTSVIRTLDQLFSMREIAVEQSDTVREAIRLFRSGRAGFADCLIAASARAAGCSRTVTFDRVAARDAGMELLG